MVPCKLQYVPLSGPEGIYIVMEGQDRIGERCCTCCAGRLECQLCEARMMDVEDH